jgi:AcrR family transcriptional regulator
MTGIGGTDGGHDAGHLVVREPRQRRTREQWDRVLDAGVTLLEQSGYEGFTIAALCQRADVPPRALYARAATKDALFLAVYERGMARVRAGEVVFEEPAAWDLGDDRERIAQAVSRLVQIFTDNTMFLKAVILISGAHPEVRRRGESYRNRIGKLFDLALIPIALDPLHDDPAQAREFCFSLVFSAMVVRTAYGPGFDLKANTDALTDELVTVAQRYLLSRTT